MCICLIGMQITTPAYYASKDDICSINYLACHEKLKKKFM